MGGGPEPQVIPTTSGDVHRTTITGPSEAALPFVQQGVRQLAGIARQPGVPAATFQQMRSGLLGAAAPTQIFQGRDPAIRAATEAAIESATERAIPTIASQFTRAGQRTSGLAQDTARRAIADIVGRQFAQSFETGEQRQLAELQANRQRALQAQMQMPQIAQLEFQLSSPEVKRRRLLDLITGAQALGVTRTGTEQQQQSEAMFRNQTAGALGGALGGATTGAQIGSFFPGIGTGIGAAIGGGLGLLGGLF